MGVGVGMGKGGEAGCVRVSPRHCNLMLAAQCDSCWQHRLLVGFGSGSGSGDGNPYLQQLGVEEPGAQAAKLEVGAAGVPEGGRGLGE